MKNIPFSPEQIAGILQELDQGKSAEEIARANGISKRTLLQWHGRYSGLAPAELQRVLALEAENARLKSMCEELSKDLDTARYIIEKKL
jgi:putative transposase